MQPEATQRWDQSLIQTEAPDGSLPSIHRLVHRLIHRAYDLCWAPVVLAALIGRAAGGALGLSAASALGHRLGSFPSSERRPSIWFHGASVGEVLSLWPVLRRLRHALPEARLTLTLCTQNRKAREMAALRLAPLEVEVVAAPLDAPDCIDRAWKNLRPDALVICECELWPNLFHRIARRGTSVLMVNARVYERDRERYRRLRRVLAPALQGVSWVGAASREDAERLVTAGLPSERIEVVGTSKFDVPLSAADELDPRFRAVLNQGRWIALASTHPGEEALVLTALGPLLAARPDLHLLIAPRHVARAGQVVRLARTHGWATSLRSGLNHAETAAPSCREGQSRVDAPRILVLDTVGELARALAWAETTFVGGSLVPAGGHNPVEPALAGSAPVIGPHHENFRPVVELFERSGGIVRVASAEDLAARMLELCDAPDAREELAARARAAAVAGRGAADRYAEAILARLPQGSLPPKSVPQGSLPLESAPHGSFPLESVPLESRSS